MFKKIKDIFNFIEEEAIEEVDFKYVDLEGKLHHLSLPVSTVDEEVLKNGMGIDASSVRGLASVEDADAIIIPDIKSGFLDMGKQASTLSFICDICDCESRKPISFSPRTIARKCEEHLKKMNIADNLLASPEFEFHIFDGVSFNITKYHAAFTAVSPEIVEEGGDYLTLVKDGEGYQVDEPFDKLHSLRLEITRAFKSSGIPVKYHHHEGGGPSQMEIEVFFKGLLETCDDIIKGKYLVRKISNRFGKKAVFLPKPLNFVSGNGMHIHLFLEKKGKSIFFDKKGKEKLSSIALNFIGGIIEHGRAITSFACASTNSYRRLVPGYEAPVVFSYSSANRSAAIRIPTYVSSSDEKRIEFRISDATANPYLLLSALLLAGMDGIEKGIDPGNPSDVNLYKKNIEGLKAIPGSLEEALYNLDKDRNFLKKDGIFNDSVIDEWIKLKKEDIKHIMDSVHPLEYELFFDI
jgi:glutamine synthetase